MEGREGMGGESGGNVRETGWRGGGIRNKH